MSLRLVLPLPPSANKLYRAVNGRVIKSKEYRDYEKACHMEIIAQGVRATRVPAAPLSFSATLYYPDKRRRDVDNALKALQDVVSRSLVFDDSLISEVHAYRKLDRDNPRCEVVLESAKEEVA